jgi:hypothetical protein
MTFTGTTDAALALRHIVYRLKLELKTGHSTSSSYSEVKYERGSLKIGIRSTGPDSLSAALVNASGVFDDERDKSNRGQLLAQGRVTAIVGAEEEYIWAGRVWANALKKQRYSVRGLDWLALTNETECEVYLAPDDVEVVDDASYRQLYPAGDSSADRLFGLYPDGSGTDPGFDEAENLRRRPWLPLDTRIFRDGGGTDEVAGELYNVSWETGTVQILEDDTGQTYYVNNLRCCVESDAAGATNCDYARLAQQALTAAAPDGMGIDPGDLDFVDTGLDVPLPFYFKGKVSDLLKVVEGVRANQRLWYDAATDKWKLEAVVQKAVGSEDIELFNARSVGIERDASQLATRVRLDVTRAMPQNGLAQAGVSFSDLGGGTEFFMWDGQDTIDDASHDEFAEVIPFIYNGDRNSGAGVRSLVAGSPYDVWHGWFKATLPSVQRLRRIYGVMPPSWHPEQARRKKDTAWLWPGIRLLVSEDDVTYRPAAPAVAGVRYPPGHELNIGPESILTPRVRYVKFYGGAYKHGHWGGFSNPSIGMLELALVFDEILEIEKTIDGNASPLTYYKYSYSREVPVAGVSTGSDYVQVAGDWTALFVEGFRFAWEGNTGGTNDGVWEVDTGGATYSAPNTTIPVTGDITGATADGVLATEIWVRNLANLWDRVSPRHITFFDDLGNRYTEAAAHDYAVQLLDEKTRQVELREWSGACDPRIKRHSTAKVTEAFSGDARTILVESAEITDNGAQASGTDYLTDGTWND